MFTKLLNRVSVTVLVLGGALSLLPIARAAQPQAAAGARIRERFEEMVTELKLSDDQQWKLREILQNQMEKAKEVQGDTNLSGEQKLKELNAIRGNFEPQLKEILRPEQVTKWEALRDRMRAEGAPAVTGDRGRNRMEEIAKELQLTDEQQSKLRDVFQGPAEEFKALRANTNLSNEQKMKEFQAIQQKIEPQVKAILTPEQFAKWQVLREKMTAQSAAGVRDRMAAIAVELKLTDEQKAKLKEVFQGPTEQIKALRANTNLTPEQKMKEYQAIQEKVEPQVKEILTPEQFTKWQAEREKLRAEMRQRFGKQSPSSK